MIREKYIYIYLYKDKRNTYIYTRLYPFNKYIGIFKTNLLPIIPMS